MVGFIMPPLPSMLSKKLRIAGFLCSASITSLHRSYEPIRHPLAFNCFSCFLQLYSLPCSANFSAGRGGFHQLLGVSLSPCCRCCPVGGNYRSSQSAASSTAFDSKTLSRPPRPSFSRLHLRLHMLRPGNSLTILTMALSMGFRSFGFPHACHSS